ncbi:MAG: dihydroorotase [Phycisphaeraceae bacterium]|nr:dihydroorotase [Phycisphaeraceae bacterium]
MSKVLIVGGKVVDPVAGTQHAADVAIDGGKVAAIGKRLARPAAARVIDAEGCLVTPGLIDPHVHLREPGNERAETIASGTAAAVEGGFTSVCCMPNTSPALDNDSMIQFVLTRAEKSGACRVFPVGAVSKGRRGEELAEIGLMARAGAVGFSDDGDCVASAGLMARALAAVKATGAALMQHCQEPTMTRSAVMHAGEVSTRLELGGWPRAAEELIIERDARLNRSIGCRYHVQHISSGESVEIVRRARAQGQPITAEATPHHLLLTHETIETSGYDTHYKMNPPLREKSDIAAIKKGIADGTIGVLGTDHAPHTAESKEVPFDSATFGIIGLETALALYARALVHDGVIDWPRLVALMTIEPARLCGLDAMGLGMLEVGGPADVTVIDPKAEWTIKPANLVGHSKNTPFIGWKVKGRAVATIVAGKVRMIRR